jgi:hypothetical protein
MDKKTRAEIENAAYHTWLTEMQGVPGFDPDSTDDDHATARHAKILYTMLQEAK